MMSMYCEALNDLYGNRPAISEIQRSQIDMMTLPGPMMAMKNGSVPMVVGDCDDDSVGSDLSGSSMGSIVSTSRVVFTGEIAFVARKGWFRVCRLSEYGQTLYTLRDDNTVKPLSVPRVGPLSPTLVNALIVRCCCMILELFSILL